MKRLTLLGLAALASGASSASINCGTPVFVSGAYVGYETKAEFPDPPKKVSFDAWALKKPEAFCGVSFTPKGDTLVIKADKLDYFGYMTTPGRLGGDVVVGSVIKRASGKEGIRVTVDLDRFYTTYKVQVYVPADLAATSAVAAKIDGGKLQPLYWPGVGGKTVEFPKTAKTVEVYLKTTQPANWQRMVLNISPSSPTLTLYRKATFPTK
ncbi:hypothetical protein Dxin01_03507 [Deinococcus xinjiangensis]|uniref:Uncharacterized protein n=1 Tax=Deinococcus xinjiangensis TaxID=457454 RepID=A0ABP9VEV3_9DEIO